MSTQTTPNGTQKDSPQGGPKTPDGKRIAARNATSHGLFARDVVLPHLGEDPEGYNTLLAELTTQLHPKNLLERHYVEKIAAASWRLRRLHRWQAQLFEDGALSEDEILLKLDRVMRHETALHRQIDTSVKMLGREVPHLFETRARKEALADLGATEAYCRQHPSTEAHVAERAEEKQEFRPVPPDLHPAQLGNICVPLRKCQNEPTPALTPPELGTGGRPNLFLGLLSTQEKGSPTPNNTAL